MGNLLNTQARKEEQAGFDKWPSLSLTWDTFQRRRQIQLETDQEADDGDRMDMEVNGFCFAGVILPEYVLEDILSKVRPQDILNCNLVCRAWKDLLTRKSYWKKLFLKGGWDWNLVPDHVKEKPEAWIVLYAQVRDHIFTKNFITNHSGEKGFDGWTHFQRNDDGHHNYSGDRWVVENPPVGCDPLPEDSFFNDINSAFVSSFSWSSNWCLIDLWSVGITPPVMITSLPFEIAFSQMYGSRFDCGAEFKWNLRVLDKDKVIIKVHEEAHSLVSGAPWNRTEYSFTFSEKDADKMDQVRYVVFTHEGKDSQFWRGHYGMKFARACIRFRCLQRGHNELDNSE